MDIRTVVRAIEGTRITLTHKELLGTWAENAAQFHAGETVAGIIRSVEPYGVFVELSPNLPDWQKVMRRGGRSAGQRIHQKHPSRQNEGKADSH